MNASQHVVLLVEDDPNDALLIQRAMKKANLVNRIIHVDDGERAVNYLSGVAPYEDRTENPLPVFMLLDLKLPRLSGHEVLSWVRAQPNLRRLPIVILTSSNERSDVAQAYDLGANSYLVKPVTFDGLFDMVKILHPYWMVLNEHPDLTQGPR
jgi:CheY-like chemotaxis protein